MSCTNTEFKQIVESWKRCDIPLWRAQEKLEELVGREEAELIAMRLFVGESPTRPRTFTGFTNGREPRSDAFQVPIVAKRNGLMYFQVTP